MQFDIGDNVSVAGTDKDPGGMGSVTAIKTETYPDKVSRKIRVDIPGNPKQDRSRKKKGSGFNGFWYDSSLVTGL